MLLTAHGELVVVRDPLGFRPLCIAEHGPLFGAASESVPLANLGFRNIRSLEPGTLAVANARTESGSSGSPPRRGRRTASSSGSTSPTSPARSTTARSTSAAQTLGKELARLEDVPLDADTIVVPVPDTAKAAADAMAYALGVPSVEGLMRNRYVGRTFIEGTADRAAKARLKYTPLPEVLAGKRVLLVEDSIVRSTTMRALVHEIRDRGGAREIHLRVACPPIIAPCYYGIDMSRQERAVRHPVRRPAGRAASRRRLNSGWPANWGRTACVTSPSRRLRGPSASPTTRLCRACITGQYPTPTGQELYQIEAACPRDSTASTAYEPAVVGRSIIGRPKDRTTFEAILPLEVGQVVEVVLGASTVSGAGRSRKPGATAISSRISPKYSSTSLATCNAPARPQGRGAI